MLKHCGRCNKDRNISEFYKASHTKSGISYICMECSRKECREYRQRNAERYYKNQTDVRNTLKGRLKECWHNANTRARKKEMAFNISLDDLNDLWQINDGKCAITGCQMTTESGPRKKANPSRVSVDRIDSTKGYAKDNIQLVCWVVNQMKGDRTEEEFKFWIETLYLAIRQSAAKPRINAEGSTTIESALNKCKRVEYASSEAEVPSPVING